MQAIGSLFTYQQNEWTLSSSNAWRIPPSWVASYDHLTLHIVPGPRSLSYFVPSLLVPVILMIPPHRLSHTTIRWVLLPGLIAFQVHVWRRHSCFDVISMDQILQGFVLLGYYDVRRDFKRIRSRQSGEVGAKGNLPGSDGQASDPASGTRRMYLQPYPLQDLKKRFVWVITLTFSLQLSNFIIGVPSHDERQLQRIRHLPRPSRSTDTVSSPSYRNFALRTFIVALLIYINLDLLSDRVCQLDTSDFIKASLIPEPASRFGTLVDSALATLCLLNRLWMALTLHTYYLPCLILLILFLPFPHLRHDMDISPLSLPKPYGRLSSIWNPESSSSSSSKQVAVSSPDIVTSTPPSPRRPPPWGLRVFWGTFWHQNMRYIASTPGVALADALRLPSRTLSRYIVITTSAFFWSGVVHAGMVPAQPLDTLYSALQLRLWIASFFWLQATGIGMGVSLDKLTSSRSTARQAGVKKAGQAHIRGVENQSPSVTIQLLRFLWTASFLAVTAWYTIRPVGKELRWWEIHPVPVSMKAWMNNEPSWARKWF